MKSNDEGYDRVRLFDLPSTIIPIYQGNTPVEHVHSMAIRTIKLESKRFVQVFGISTVKRLKYYILY